MQLIVQLSSEVLLPALFFVGNSVSVEVIDYLLYVVQYWVLFSLSLTRGTVLTAMFGRVEYTPEMSPLSSPITGAIFYSASSAVGAGIGAAIMRHHVALEMILLWYGGFICGGIGGAIGGLVWRLGGRDWFAFMDGLLQFALNMAAPAVGLAMFPIAEHLPSYLVLLVDMFVGILIITATMAIVTLVCCCNWSLHRLVSCNRKKTSSC